MKRFMRENPEELIAALLIVVTTTLVLINVFFRYFLSKGIYWSEEVATSCFVWSIFLGSAGAYRCGAQLGIDLLVNQLPKTARHAVKFLVQCILLVINGYIFYLSVIYVQKTHGIATSVLGVSSAYVSSALVVGFGLMTVYSLLQLLRLPKMFREEERKEEQR